MLVAGIASPAAAITFRKDRLAKPGGQPPPVKRLLVQFRLGTSDTSRDDIVRNAGGRTAPPRLPRIRALAVGSRGGRKPRKPALPAASSDRVQRVEDD